ncbi:MAG: sugar ABC transporter permease [Candidatus Thermoplasmatota archaeon]|nr:sugar ABC transporter permease [Candidatus Thermoplasmatota archaeon]
MLNVTEADSGGYSERKIRRSHILKDLFYFSFALPAIAYVFILAIVPAGSAILFSFFKYDTHTLTLSNYYALPGIGIYGAIVDTAVVSIGALLIQLFFALFLASLMMKPFKGNKLFSLLVIIPFGVSTVVSAYVFSLIFQAFGGFANGFVMLFKPLFLALGLKGIATHGIDWFANKWSSLGVVMFSDFWKNTPLIALILYGGMSSLSPSMYEAAAVDGAGPLRRFFYITLPNIAPLMAVALIIRGVSEFNIFALPLVIIGYSPKLLNTLIYEYYPLAITRPWAYSASVVLLVIIMAFAAIVLYLGGAPKNGQ